MDYLARVAAGFTILGIVLHRLGIYSERRKNRRRHQLGHDWLHWVRSPEGMANFRQIIREASKD